MNRRSIFDRAFVGALFAVWLVASASTPVGAQSDQPYKLQDVLVLLRGKVSTGTILSTVSSKCRDFAITRDVRSAILAAGGTNELLGGLMGVCQKSSAAAAAAAAPARTTTPAPPKRPARPAPRETPRNTEEPRPERRADVDPDKVYSLTEVDEPAAPVTPLKMAYSDEMRAYTAKWDNPGVGVLIAKFVIEPNGKIARDSIEFVAGGDGTDVLSQAVKKAVLALRFSSGKTRGRRVRQQAGVYFVVGPGDTLSYEPVTDTSLFMPPDGYYIPDKPAKHIIITPPAPLPTAPPTPGLEEVAARVRVFRFFEGPRTVPELGNRQYIDRFDTQAARFIYVELELDFVGRSGTTTFSLPCNFIGPAGDVVNSTTIDGSRGPGVGTFIAIFGRGWDATGNWGPGKYQAACTYKDKVVAEGTFEVAGVTVASAYAAGEEAARAQQWAAAAAEYRLATELSPDAPLYQYKLGHSLAKAGSFAEAEPPLLRAVELAPNEVSYRWELVQLLLGRERHQDVEPHFRRLVQLDAANAALHAQFGELLVKNGKIADAITAFQKAASLSPGEAYYTHRLQQLSTQPPE